MEIWLENPDPTWRNITACCSITNHGLTPYPVFVSTGSGAPCLYVTLVDRLGKHAAATSPQAEFFSPGQAPLGSRSCRLFPGESMIVQFKLAEHFQGAELEAAQLTAMWSGDFGDWVRPHTLTQTLLLPKEPTTIQRPLPWRMEFTSRELADRENRMLDGLQPLPPRSFLERHQAASNALENATPARQEASHAQEAPVQHISLGTRDGWSLDFRLDGSADLQFGSLPHDNARTGPGAFDLAQVMLILKPHLEEKKDGCRASVVLQQVGNTSFSIWYTRDEEVLQRLFRQVLASSFAQEPTRFNTLLKEHPILDIRDMSVPNTPRFIPKYHAEAQLPPASGASTPHADKARSASENSTPDLGVNPASGTRPSPDRSTTASTTDQSMSTGSFSSSSMFWIVTCLLCVVGAMLLKAWLKKTG